MSHAEPPPPLPQPRELRLVRTATAAGTRAPKPPLGFAAWTESPTAAVVVLLDLPEGWVPPGLDAVNVIADQVPPASALAEGALVIVLGTGEPRGGLVSRLLQGRPRIARAVRATALLAQGYVGIGAGLDPSLGDDLTWGYAPAR